MNRFTREVDFFFSNPGDFFLDEEKGDYLDTSEIVYGSLIQRMNNQLKSDSGDWKLQPSVGANLSNFFTRANTAATADEIKISIETALISTEMFAPSELFVDLFPLDKDEMAILINARPVGSSTGIMLALTYDPRDNKIIPRN